MSLLRILIGVTLVLGLLAPLAMAQGPTLNMVADKSTVALGPNQTSEITWTVSNSGTTGGPVTFTVTAPSGWTLDPAQPSSITLGGATGGSLSQTVKMTVAPAAGKVPANGTLTLSGTLTDAKGTSSSKSSAVALGYNAPAIPPPPVPPADHTLAWTLGIASGVAVILFVLYLAQSFQVALTLPNADKNLNVGTDGAYLLQVTNRARTPRNIRLRLRGLPAGLYAAFSYPSIKLQGGETAQVPLLVKVPVDAAVDSQIPLKVQARPNGFSPWLVGTVLNVRVVDVMVDRKARASPVPA